MPGGIHGGGYPEMKQKLYKYFLSDDPNRKMFLIQGDSHENATLEKIKTAFLGNKIDFLFIDGGHTYSGVKQDFEKYAPIVRKDGIIVFHDIIPNTTSNENS